MMKYEEQFKENGFCIIREAISRDLVARANEQIDAFRAKNDSLLIESDLLVSGLLQRVVNLHFSVTALQDVFSHAMEVGQKVCDQYGKATLYSSLFYELGSQQPLHRDTPYFFSGSGDGYMGVWVALDDVDQDNGALITVKGSHRLAEPNLAKLKNRFYPNEDVPASSTPLFEAFNSELITAAEEQGLVTEICAVQKGDMIIWDPSTLHGGLPHNDKTRTRRSFVMHITPQNMPMKHMDYFFHRDKPIEEVSKSYLPVGEGRLISAGDIVDFRHVKSFRATELGVF